MKKIFTKATFILASLTFLIGFSLPVISVYAADSGASGSSQTACDAINQAFGDASCSTTDSTAAKSGLGTIIKEVIEILSWVVGAVSVIMLIIGGFRYIISGGDTNATTGAKNTIIYALVGLVIVVFAQVIVIFVINNI